MSPIDREHVEFVCPDQLEERTLRPGLAPEGVPGKVLVADPEGGNGAALLYPPGGWSGGGARVADAFELVVLDGALDVEGRRLGQYGYLSVAAGERCPALTAEDGTALFVDVISDVSESVLIESEDDGFHDREDDGHPMPAPGLMLKVLRGSTDGARSFLLRIPPGWREERTEWHEVAEASIRLEGSLWSSRANDGEGGLMTRHCYFWRPPYKLHSPMHSDDGSLSFITVDGKLINHYVEDEGLPPQ